MHTEKGYSWVDFSGQTYYYEGNSYGHEPTPDFYFTPPFGVRILSGVVRYKIIKRPWDLNTRFYCCSDMEFSQASYGTAQELAFRLDTSAKVIRGKSKKHTLFRERYYIEEVEMEEFFKATGRYYREERDYAGPTHKTTQNAI